jgi:hypothetical protein
MPKLIAFFLSSFLLLLPSPGIAKHEDLLLSMNGHPYAEARSRLFSMGYRPFHAKNRDTPDEVCPGFSSCSAIPEIVYCSGTGLAFCESAFFNRRNGRYIKVVSYGEGTKLVDGIYLATNLDIRDWRFGTR